MSGITLLLESTDAGLFVTFSATEVPSRIPRALVSGAVNSGAVAISANSVEIVQGSHLD